MRNRTFNFWRILLWALGGLTVPAVIWAAVGGPVVTNSETGTAFPEKLGKNPAPGRVLQMPTGTDQRGAYWTTIETMPSGTPGQIPQVANTTGTYTLTATGTQTMMTGTQTTTTTEWKATTGTIDFDPMGTFFLGNCEDLCAIRWKDLPNGTFPYEVSGTCSTGNDALLGSWPSVAYEFSSRSLWPAGAWLAKLRAKVDANGAAIRVEVWDDEIGGTPVQWFNWTTDVFSNTATADVQKLTFQGERSVTISPAHRVTIKLYATCSTSTLVTLSEARVESPYTVDVTTQISDVNGLQGALDGKEGSLSYGYPGQALGYIGTGTDLTSTKGPIDVETGIPGGAPGRVVGYLGTGTATTTSKGPVDREVVVSGTPGQFVKFAGTGTATTTSKEGVTVSIPTPVTTRYFTVGAGALPYVSGAAHGQSDGIDMLVFRNSNNDRAYGATIIVPADYISGLAVSPLWYPTTSGNTSDTVRWTIGHLGLTAGSSYSAPTATSWTGVACGSACTATFILVAETAQAFGSYSAGTPVVIYIERNGSNGGDTYAGNVDLIGLRFSYTSSL